MNFPEIKLFEILICCIGYIVLLVAWYIDCLGT